MCTIHRYYCFEVFLSRERGKERGVREEKIIRISLFFVFGVMIKNEGDGDLNGAPLSTLAFSSCLSDGRAGINDVRWMGICFFFPLCF